MERISKGEQKGFRMYTLFTTGVNVMMLELVKFSPEDCPKLIGLAGLWSRRTIWYHSPAMQAQDVTWLQNSTEKQYLRLVNKPRSIFCIRRGAVGS